MELYEETITPSKHIKPLGNIIDEKLRFRAHIATACASAAKVGAMITVSGRRKVIWANTQSHLVRTMAIPILSWGSPIRWTGEDYVLKQMGPSYNNFARHITGLPRWTPIKFVLEACLPPLKTILDQLSRSYGIRVLTACDSHPCKKQLQSAMTGPQSTVGLLRIATLLKNAFGAEMEDSSDPRNPYLQTAIIAKSDKATEGAAHKNGSKHYQQAPSSSTRTG